MKHLFTTFLFALLMANGFSQDEKIIFKLSPLALIDDITFPTIQGGIEFRLKDRVSWHNEIGFKYRTGDYEYTDSSFINSTHNFKLKTEIRYYLPRFLSRKNTDGSLNGFYIGGNLFFNRDYHNSGISYYFEKDSSNFVTDDFAVKKKIIGTNIVFGIQQPSGKRILVDFYVGLGFRFRFIDNLNREYDSNRDTMNEPISIIYRNRNNIDLKEGVSGNANFTLGLRICYKI